jgi:hypothetical protein
VLHHRAASSTQRIKIGLLDRLGQKVSGTTVHNRCLVVPENTGTHTNNRRDAAFLCGFDGLGGFESVHARHTDIH